MKNYRAPKQTSVHSKQPSSPPTKETPKALLKTRKAANHLDLSPRTLESWRLKGGGPPFIALSPKAVRYHPDDLESWIATRRRKSTSDTGKNRTGKA